MKDRSRVMLEMVELRGQCSELVKEVENLRRIFLQQHRELWVPNNEYLSAISRKINDIMQITDPAEFKNRTPPQLIEGKVYPLLIYNHPTMGVELKGFHYGVFVGEVASYLGYFLPITSKPPSRGLRQYSETITVFKISYIRYNIPVILDTRKVLGNHVGGDDCSCSRRLLNHARKILASIRMQVS